MVATSCVTGRFTSVKSLFAGLGMRNEAFEQGTTITAIRYSRLEGWI